MPDVLMSVSSMDESSSLGTMDTMELTPDSLHSLEQVTEFPSRHLLADFSPSQLDRNFSDSPDAGSGDRFSSTPSSGVDSFLNHFVKPQPDLKDDPR